MTAVVPARTPWYYTYLLDPLERAGMTFVQQAVVLLMATGFVDLHSIGWAHIADMAGFAAILSILTTLATFTWNLSGYADLAIRTVKTFLQSFVGVLIAGPAASITGADWRFALATAVPAAFLAFLKGLASLGVPITLGASAVPHPGLLAA